MSNPLRFNLSHSKHETLLISSRNLRNVIYTDIGSNKKDQKFIKFYHVIILLHAKETYPKVS